MEADYGSTTHYALLGLEPVFELEHGAADRAYKQLQRKLHPDNFAQAGPEQLELAEAHSARLNEAVAVLRSPLRRAGYWMELQGLRVLEEDQRMDDAATMMEVMEVSEAIEEASTQRDIDSLIEQNAAKVRDVESQLAGIFRAEDWDAARRLVERLQMLERLSQRLNDWQAP